MNADITKIQNALQQRQDELRQLASYLGRRAKLNLWAGSAAKALLVVFGALTATKSAVDQVLGTSSATGTVVYAALGVLTASVAGLTAAFDFDRRAAQLTQLATEAWAALREVDSAWRREVEAADPVAASDGSLKLISFQDSTLADLERRAARLGINVAVDVSRLVAWEGRPPFPA